MAMQCNAGIQKGSHRAAAIGSERFSWILCVFYDVLCMFYVAVVFLVDIWGCGKIGKGNITILQSEHHLDDISRLTCLIFSRLGDGLKAAHNPRILGL